jgi:hypothetical protein
LKSEHRLKSEKQHPHRLKSEKQHRTVCIASIAIVQTQSLSLIRQP